MMYRLLMTVASTLLLACSFIGSEPIYTFALYLSGVFMGHALTDLLNEG